MRYTVGYDRNLMRCFFTRNIRSLSNTPEFQRVGGDEVEYLAGEFADIFSTSESNDLACPETKLGLGEFAVLHSSQRLTRRQRQMAENLANRYLFFQGFNANGGLGGLKALGSKDKAVHVIRALYRNSAAGSFRRGDETALLRKIADNTEDWMNLLWYLVGLDSYELIDERRFSRLVWIP